MIKHCLFILASLFFTHSLIGQDRLDGDIDTTKQVYAKNNVYLELAGKGLFYSINYERRLFNLGEKTSLTASAGMCIFPGLTTVKKSKDFLMPFSINIQHHLKKNHHLAYGVGSTYYTYQVNDIVIEKDNLSLQPLTARLKSITEWFGHLNIEYRYQNPKKGIMYKVGLTPLFFHKMQNFTGFKSFHLSANVGVGYAF